MVLENAAATIGKYEEALERDRCVLLSHSHRFGVDTHGHAFLELSYITEGEVEHTLDGRVERLSRGDYLIVDYGSRHSYRNRAETAFSNIDCLFLPELLDPALKGARTLRAVLEHYLLHFNMRSPMQDPSRIVFHDEDGRVRELLGHIRRELGERTAGFSELVRCYLVEILLLTVRRLEGAQSAMQAPVLSAGVCAYVAEHYREPLTLQGIAAAMSYSLPYLSRRFKEEMGMGFAHYLQTYRVTQACRLLEGTTLTFGEITEAVGYRDPKSFAALIKEQVGASPAALRRRRRR